ncbi:hypothetical protein E2C01_096942 [Portunus trituberculatus]|uniref:Uncharacterized protein n=1 Tax=Portunus trituberculatus TaxID=210409 RepID=A0A5B7K9T9_PORTR|nr:hypothetical protein [Portunus trituberculatus]
MKKSRRPQLTPLTCSSPLLYKHGANVPHLSTTLHDAGCLVKDVLSACRALTLPPSPSPSSH